MTEFTANAKSIFDKAKAARTDILNLDPSVQRIDDYAGTKFTPTVDQFRSVSLLSSIKKMTHAHNSLAHRR